MTYNAHALPCGDEGGDTQGKREQSNNTPGAARFAQAQKDTKNKAGDDEKDAETTSEDDTRAIAITNCPADEIRMRLIAESPFNVLDNLAEGGRMGGQFQRMEGRRNVAGRQVQLARRFVGKVNGNDA